MNNGPPQSPEGEGFQAKNDFADLAKRFFKRKMTLQTLRNDFSSEK
jgi:hypothetical protein